MRYLIAIALFAAPWYMVVSTASYHDAQAVAQHCEAMVTQGAWPESACER